MIRDIMYQVRVRAYRPIYTGTHIHIHAAHTHIHTHIYICTRVCVGETARYTRSHVKQIGTDRERTITNVHLTHNANHRMTFT